MRARVETQTWRRCDAYVVLASLAAMLFLVVWALALQLQVFERSNASGRMASRYYKGNSTVGTCEWDTGAQCMVLDSIWYASCQRILCSTCDTFQILPLAVQRFSRKSIYGSALAWLNPGELESSY